MRLHRCPHRPTTLRCFAGTACTSRHSAWRYLRAVSDQPHRTAAEIASAVRSEIGAISLQAVYDALATLAGKGIVRRIQPAGSSARYEDRVEDHHHHLICRACGRTVDVDGAVGETLCLTAAEGSGYEIDEAKSSTGVDAPDCVTAGSVSSAG